MLLYHIYFYSAQIQRSPLDIVLLHSILSHPFLLKLIYVYWTHDNRSCRIHTGCPVNYFLLYLEFCKILFIWGIGFLMTFATVFLAETFWVCFGLFEAGRVSIPDIAISLSSFGWISLLDAGLKLSTYLSTIV